MIVWDVLSWYMQNSNLLVTLQLINNIAWSCYAHLNYQCTCSITFYSKLFIWKNCVPEQTYTYSLIHYLPHCPAQKHSWVHFKFAFTHLHRLLQSCLHPYLNKFSSWHAFEASGSVIQQGIHGELTVLSQPHGAGEGRVGSPCRHWPHMWPAWYTARFTWWTSAPVIRGMFSILRFPEASILFLASSTLLREDVRWYNRSTDQHIFLFRSCLQVIDGLDLLITYWRQASDDSCCTKWTKLVSFLRIERLRPCHIQTLHMQEEETPWWFSIHISISSMHNNIRWTIPNGMDCMEQDPRVSLFVCAAQIWEILYWGRNGILTICENDGLSKWKLMLLYWRCQKVK